MGKLYKFMIVYYMTPTYKTQKSKRSQSAKNKPPGKQHQQDKNKPPGKQTQQSKRNPPSKRLLKLNGGSPSRSRSPSRSPPLSITNNRVIDSLFVRKPETVHILSTLSRTLNRTLPKIDIANRHLIGDPEILNRFAISFVTKKIQ